MSEPQPDNTFIGRVTRLETELIGLSKRVDDSAKVIDQLREEGRSQAQAIVNQIDSLRRSDEVGRERLAAVGKPNWGVVIAAVSLGVLVVGAIGSAWVLPLAKADKVHDDAIVLHERTIDAIRERESQLRADMARLDERSKFAVYVGGVKPTKESP